MSARTRLASQGGYSLVELLVSSAIMLTVTGAIFGLVNPAQGTAQAQPEASDMQQRMRVAADTLFRELLMAGAGPYQGATTGSLINFFAPILPRRTGLASPDASTVFRADAITLAYIPNSFSQTSLSASMPQVSAELKVTQQSNCPLGQQLCGFTEGMVVIIFDSTGYFDTFTITQVQDDAGHLQHNGQDLNHEYGVGAAVTQIVSNTYYRNATTNQLMKYDGAASDLPIVDNLVGLQFEYFGDVNPPKLPKPPAGVANCLYDATGAQTALPVLTADEGSLASLGAAMLTDGPWCGGGSNEFDADLLRVRKVRVTLRMQAASAALRGQNTTLFANPGTSDGGGRLLPDYFVRFEVTPRNLNLTR
jgi:type II secretory pathway pseudopilin PulG